MFFGNPVLSLILLKSCAFARNILRFARHDHALGAGILLLSRYKGDRPLINPMCGSGTPAIEAAIDLMGRDAILNIAVYPGHEEGDAEGRMICEYLAGISRYKICATRVNILNSPTSPYFIIVETKP